MVFDCFSFLCVFSGFLHMCLLHPMKTGAMVHGSWLQLSRVVHIVRADVAPGPLPPAFLWAHREEWLLLLSLASSWFYNCALFSRSWWRSSSCLLISWLYCFLQLQSATPDCEDLPKVSVLSSKDQVGSSQKEQISIFYNYNFIIKLSLHTIFGLCILFGGIW